ncbi:unnamed protein product [Chrysoparadoxa australica]
MRTKKTTKKAMMGELRSLAMISAGLIAGSMGGKAIDKVLKVDDSVPGFQAKKFVRPVALLGAGVLGSVKLTNPDLKMLSAGIGASGVVSTLKVVTKKDLLSGGLSGQLASSAHPMEVYDDSAFHQVEQYNPELPLLPSKNYLEENLASSSPGEAAVEYSDAEIEFI